jgi:hypothetical protein
MSIRRKASLNCRQGSREFAGEGSDLSAVFRVHRFGMILMVEYELQLRPGSLMVGRLRSKEK